VVRCWPRASGRHRKRGRPLSAKLTCDSITNSGQHTAQQVLHVSLLLKTMHTACVSDSGCVVVRCCPRASGRHLKRGRPLSARLTCDAAAARKQRQWRRQHVSAFGMCLSGSRCVVVRCCTRASGRHLKRDKPFSARLTCDAAADTTAACQCIYGVLLIRQQVCGAAHAPLADT
jgi:hypothetical protein